MDTPPPPVYDTTAADTYTTTQYGGVVIHKPTGNVQAGEPDDTSAADAQTATADAAPNPTQTDKDVEKDAATTEKDTAAPLIPWWAWLGMSVVALLLIGAVVAIILLSRPMKP